MAFSPTGRGDTIVEYVPEINVVFAVFEAVPISRDLVTNLLRKGQARFCNNSSL